MTNGTRVVLVIDRLGPAGGQRDLCRLALHLKRQGYDIEVLVFREANFFFGLLAQVGVTVVHIPSRNRLHLAYAMRKAIRKRGPSVVIAFLEGASMLVELAGLPRRDFAVIVTEFGFDASNGFRRTLHSILHLLADAVICNSHAQRHRIDQMAPYLRRRTHVVVNGVDLDYFRPANPPRAASRNQLRMLVLASFRPVKNPFGLLAAVDIVYREHPELDLVVDWYGEIITHRGSEDSKWRYERAQYYNQLEETILERSLEGRFRLHPACQDVVPLYHAADVVCLPSLSEGTPNVICEAMACGVPVLATRVGGIPHLVYDGRTGVLIDSASPRNIAQAIVRFAALPLDARRAMGLAGRDIAERSLSTKLFVNRYIHFIDQVVAQQRRRPLGFPRTTPLPTSISEDPSPTHQRAHPPGISNSRIRLAYVVSTLRRCGPTNQLLNILRHLDYDNFEISVITLSPEPSDSLIDEVAQFPVKIHPLNLKKLSGFRWLRKQFRATVKSIRPDLIHSSGWRPDLLASELNWSSRWVATCRNIPHVDYPLRFGKVLGTLVARQHIRALRKCANLVCCSNALRSGYQNRYMISRAVVIPNGVTFHNTTQRVQLHSWSNGSRDVLRCIAVGQLIPRKNIHYLCEIFMRLNSGGETLTVLGDGPEYGRLSRYQCDHITFVGHQNDIYPYLANSHLFLSASLAEGMPNSVLEALAIGLPCLLSDIEPHREIKMAISRGIETFCLTDPPDVVAGRFPAYFERLMKVSRQQIRRNTRQRYSAERMAYSYQKMYSRLSKRD